MTFNSICIDAELPYQFDLLYDIKTVRALYQHLTGESRAATSATDQELLDLMLEQGIPVPEGYTAPIADLTRRYAEATAVLQALYEHLAPSPDSGPDSGWMRDTIKELFDCHAIPVAGQKDPT